jgi:hypothetical protein
LWLGLAFTPFPQGNTPSKPDTRHHWGGVLANLDAVGGFDMIVLQILAFWAIYALISVGLLILLTRKSPRDNDGASAIVMVAFWPLMLIIGLFLWMMGIINAPKNKKPAQVG